MVDIHAMLEQRSGNGTVTPEPALDRALAFIHALSLLVDDLVSQKLTNDAILVQEAITAIHGETVLFLPEAPLFVGPELDRLAAATRLHPGLNLHVLQLAAGLTVDCAIELLDAMKI